MRLKVSYAKWRVFCLGLNGFTVSVLVGRLPTQVSGWKDTEAQASKLAEESTIFENSNILKTHVHGLFDTDLHEVSWHFATHEAVRPSGF